MDPDYAWQAIVDGYSQRTRERAELYDAADGLREWIRKDGFAPRITGNVDLDRKIAVCVCDSLIQETAY